MVSGACLESVYGSDEWTGPTRWSGLMVRVEDVSLPGYGASQVTRLVVQNKVAMSVAEAATTIG